MSTPTQRYNGREHRRAERRKLGRPASIDVGDGSPLHPCVISDISATGAKLVALTAGSVPDQFDLLLAGASGPRRKANVMWRAGSSLGVRFVSAG
jgi:hypothetical protein